MVPNYHSDAPEKSGNRGRMTLILVAILAVFWNKPQQFLFPHGLPVHIDAKDRPFISSVDYDNKSMTAATGKIGKFVERVPEGSKPILKGPESVFFDRQGVMYVMTEDSKLLKFTDFIDEGKENSISIISAKVTELLDLGIGRPLGGKFAKDGTLYIANTLLGLTRVRFAKNERLVVELVASKVKIGEEWSAFRYTNDIDIGPKTGCVYFTDSTDIAPDRIGTYSWDTLYASKLDLMKGKKTGRLLRYNPKTENVDILADGIWFANGVAVDKDETFVMIVETFSSRVLKYHLTDKVKKGTVEVMVEGFPGYPDGADCSFATGKCYSALPSSQVKVINLMQKLPNYTDLLPRALMMLLPRSLAPKVTKYGGVVEIFPEDTKKNGYGSRILQDPWGEDITFLTGVTESGGKLYLGSLKNDYIGVYEL